MDDRTKGQSSIDLADFTSWWMSVGCVLCRLLVEAMLLFVCLVICTVGLMLG